MIIVKIHSGLGNQLFQYAYARNLSIITGHRLYIYIGELRQQEKLHKKSMYRLNYFNIIEEFASEADVLPLKRKELGSFIYKVYRKITCKKYKLYNNNNFQISDDTYLRDKYKIGKSDILYLDGYWGNEKYFRENAVIIRNDLKLKSCLNSSNTSYLHRIHNCCSIGVHIRRNDYLNHVNIFKILEYSYYQHAFEHMNSKVENPVFFVFSDDIEGAKNLLTKLEVKYTINYVDVNSGDTDYMELMLMSECKHFIIANSTFSWWGAWLNNNPEKIIIAPKVWFNDKNYQREYEKGTLIPPEWIKL